MAIDSTDYHDYVIKEGKLIGEFEQMYQKSDGVPWHQNEQKKISMCAYHMRCSVIVGQLAR